MMKTGFEKAQRIVGQCPRLLLAALLLLSAIALGQTQPPAKPEPAAIRPFKLHVPDRVLIDLRHRLAEATWPDQLPGTTWAYGADIKKVRELADYWQNGYDWRAQEAKINQLDQFTTEIDGQHIYFIHQRSPRPDAIPLMLIHGWPGSILEFEKLIGPLTHPTDKNSPAFDVIIPSLPKYGVQGGDWGSAIAQDMAYQAPTHVIGLHLNQIYVPPPNQEAVAKMSDAERKRYSYFDREESSFFFLQTSEPQTLAYALTDSPVVCMMRPSAISSSIFFLE
jgi:microsomal epoxide hydrolase